VQVDEVGKRRCKPGERRSKEGLYENVRGFIVCNAGSIIRGKSLYLKYGNMAQKV
jgi:hypothetical protein